MIEIRGRYNRAVCFAAELDDKAAEQIRAVCDRPEFADCRIRIMPDVHAGMGCTIGTTMTIGDKIVPGMVGVDIGCGMETVKIKPCEVDFERLDKLIRREIPSGREIREAPHRLAELAHTERLRCASRVNTVRASLSIGTLGGGNHFIEIDRGEADDIYLVVHTGSRHLGKEVAEYYQNEGYRSLCADAKRKIRDEIERLKSSGMDKSVYDAVKTLKKHKKAGVDIPRELAYVEGELFDDYLHDMKIVQSFAELNRRAVTEIIMEGMGWVELDRFTTVHNYIDTAEMILRKGAVSAREGERLLIPINMRDGSLICVGKGAEEWNRSAPHGAGRIMSRNAAISRLSIEQYREEMQGIFTTCVGPDTLDEAPMAYKSMEEIVNAISPTAELVERIRPIYNFKAAD
ncbi:MAG: RtcB family protein [Clostridia bacterium]|nr:RtcB family protein [Clostridia bacterium]